MCRSKDRARLLAWYVRGKNRAKLKSFEGWGYSSWAGSCSNCLRAFSHKSLYKFPEKTPVNNFLDLIENAC